jgi:hypothetical protein
LLLPNPIPVYKKVVGMFKSVKKRSVHEYFGSIPSPWTASHLTEITGSKYGILELYLEKDKKKILSNSIVN